MFSPLTKEDLYKIIDQQIKRISSRLEDKDIDIVVEKDACDVILNNSFDPVYGARPLKRYLEKNIVTELSKLILSNKLSEHQTVTIRSGEHDKLEFEIEEFPPLKKRKYAEKNI